MYIYDPVTCFSQLLILYINISDIYLCHLFIWCFIVSLDCTLLNNSKLCSQEQVCVSVSFFLYFWDQTCFLCAKSQSINLKNSLFSPFLLHFDSYTVSWNNASCHTYSLPLFFSFPVYIQWILLWLIVLLLSCLMISSFVYFGLWFYWPFHF